MLTLFAKERIMHKYIVLLIFAIVIFSFGNAEARKAQADQQINWKKELDLNKEQQAQVKEIYNQSHDKIKSLMTQIDTLHQEIANVRQEDEAKIRTLLNEKQQIKFDKLQMRLNRNNPEYKGKNGKKPSRKRMRNYGGLNLQS